MSIISILGKLANYLSERWVLKQKNTDDKSKLMLAVSYQSKEAVKDELNLHRGDVFQTDREGRTALFYAAERGDEEIVWVLLSSLAGTGMACQRGALLEVRDSKGNLAEDWALIKGHKEISKILSIERQRIAFFE